MNRVLHIVQESVENSRHRFLGSVKDTLGRTEYFASRHMPVEQVVAEGRSDKTLVARLDALDLSSFGTAVFELPIYPRALRLLRRKAPHVRRLTRPINAELLHQVHLFRAHRAYPYVRDQRLQLLHDVRTGFQRLRLDRLCARRSDAILSISDWETNHYWRWLAGRWRTHTVPYFRPSSLTADLPRGIEKEPLCVCMLSTAKSVRPFPLDALVNFERFVRGYQAKSGPWTFAMTGSTSVNHRWRQVVDARLIIRGQIEQLGFVDDPMPLLARARAVAVLSDLGFGFKTKILDAIASRCWVLVSAGLHERLSPELRPYCLVVPAAGTAADFRRALERAMEPFPDGDPNGALRARAFAALDELVGPA